MRQPNSRQRNTLKKEIRQLHDDEYEVATSPITCADDALVSQMLARYHEKTAAEDAFYDNFISWYLDWKAFSEPIIYELESTKPRRASDQDLSCVWEKALVAHRPR